MLGMLWTEHFVALATGIFVLIISLAIYMKPSDPYGSFHLSLNKLPGESPHADPRTEWLNMGYWKVSGENMKGDDELMVSSS
jgi:hypothetical protein